MYLASRAICGDVKPTSALAFYAEFNTANRFVEFNAVNRLIDACGQLFLGEGIECLTFSVQGLHLPYGDGRNTKRLAYNSTSCRSVLPSRSRNTVSGESSALATSKPSRINFLISSNTVTCRCSAS